MSGVASAVPERSSQGRRKYLAILFSDLSESTRLAATIEAEHYAELLAALRAIYEDVVPRHRGTVVRIQGDGMLAIFGHPHPGEHDGRNAVHAALELHARVRALHCEPPLPSSWLLNLHSGIHAGLVLVDEGDVLRGRFELLGNAPNIAARLAEMAEHDQILVSEATLGTERHFFETGVARHVVLRGATEPVTVHRILGRAAVQTRFEASAQRGLLPFVGRAEEMRLLELELQHAMKGVPGQVAIAAGAGVGKTRLVVEFLRIARSRDCQIHRGHCESNISAEPLQPLLQMLRALFRIDTVQQPAEANDRLAHELALLGDDAQRFDETLSAMLSLQPQRVPSNEAATPPQQAIQALRSLFDQLALRRPQVLFIDDWQWADDATRLAVDAIRQLKQRPILVLLTTRSVEAGVDVLNDFRAIELAPFTEPEVEQAVVGLLPGADPFLADAIGRHSGGNPLFIEELCHAALHDPADARLRRVLGGAAWLDALIESRVARLPESQATVLRAAAVIGNVVPVWLLEVMTGRSADDPAIAGLAQLDFLFGGEQTGTLRFKHGITRDVIYAAVGLHERVAMHQHIARVLHERFADGAHGETLEALAYHFGSGGLHAEAADFAERAAEKAMSVSALDRAQALFRAAMNAIDHAPASEANRLRWAELARRLGLACVFDPSRDHLDILQQAAQRAAAQDDPASVAHAQYWLGYLYYGLGESRLAIAHCETALRAALNTANDPLTVQIRATLGQALAAGCEYDRALLLLDESIGVKKRYRSGKRPAVGLAYSLTCRASVLGDRGDFALAYECFDEAFDAVRGAHHEIEGSLFCWRSAVHLWQGQWPQAQQAAAHAQQVARRAKSLYLVAMGRALAAYAHWVQHRDALSLRTIVDATAWIEARQRGQYISLNHGWLADAHVSAGQMGLARHHAACALMRARAHDPLGQAMAHRAMARAHGVANKDASARQYLDRAMSVAVGRQSRHEVAATQLCRAEFEALRGERGIAMEQLDQTEPAFESMQMAWHLGQAVRLRGRL